MDRIERLNLINSITGIKPANLIGTKSGEGKENLAIFSSVVHLGSNPPLLGCITRPTDEVPRHTYENIKRNKQYSINALPLSASKNGHYTSAKFDSDFSEFEACGFTPQYIDGFDAPLVKESPIKIALELVEEIAIQSNGTKLLVGEVLHLHIDDQLLTDQGYLDLERARIAGISGLNSYYGLTKHADYPYARVEDWDKEKDLISI